MVSMIITMTAIMMTPWSDPGDYYDDDDWDYYDYDDDYAYDDEGWGDYFD